MDQKKYDIVLFGATGFTGRLTAEYLAKAQTQEDFTWAIAGRSLKKLNALKRQLHEIAPKAHVGVIKADIEQLASLNAMTAQCRVLMTTVGPYIQYGEPVVRACIEQSAHYVDLTGEPEFVDRLRHKFDKKARSSKLKIVNSCGFDSIPHDLGALFTINELGKHIDADNPAEATARESIKLEGFVKASADFSGGTWHSAINAFARYRKYLKEQSYWKKKEAQAYPQDQRLIKAVRMDVSYRDSLQAWALPFPTIDPQVVRRSAQATAAYGERFEYGHYALFDHLPKAVASAMVLGGVFTLSQLKLTRNLLLGVKDQGEGPSQAERDEAWFTVVMQAQSTQHKLSTKISGGDPGYTETSKMLAEAALCLVLDKELPDVAGVITPAMAMGNSLITRLQNAGIKFEVTEAS